MTKPALADEAPSADALTAYDEAHFTLYMQLLDAEAARAPEAAVCEELLGLDFARDPERARKCLKSHLERARWFSSSGGFRHLLDREVPEDAGTDARS